MTFGLIRQPEAGWMDATVAVPLLGGIVLFAAFIAYEARSFHPMLPLGLFRSHNFSVGNLETLTMYAGLSLLFFFLVLFLQQIAGYSAVAAGAASLPVTVLMFALSRRFGALADRYGPRLFMTTGPLLMAVGLVLFRRLDADVNYLTDLLPALLLFGTGLSMTVAPLTATVLAGADEQNAGIASGSTTRSPASPASWRWPPSGRWSPRASARRSTIAWARAATRPSRPRSRKPSGGRWHLGMAISAGLVGLGGLLGLAIRNPRREVRCSECSGGQLVGVPQDTARATDREVAVPA